MIYFTLVITSEILEFITGSISDMIYFTLVITSEILKFITGSISEMIYFRIWIIVEIRIFRLEICKILLSKPVLFLMQSFIT
jgi:hypothetical protein